MKNKTQAMLWEIWRTSRSDLLILLAGQLLFVLLLCSLHATVPNLQDEVGRKTLVSLLITMAGLMSLFSTSWIYSLDSNSRGFSFRLGFTRPVSTFQLIAVPIIFSAIIAPVCYLLPASIFRLLTGLYVPLVMPTLMSSVAIVCLIAFAWSPQTLLVKSVGLIVFALGGIGLLLFMHQQRDHPNDFLTAIGQPGYFQSGWQHFLTGMVIMAVAFCVTWFAVDRQRHGERWLSDKLSGLKFRDRSHANSLTAGSFGSRFSAQCWFEMRRFGWKIVVPGMIAAVLLFAIVMAMAIFNQYWGGAQSVWMFAIGLAPIACQFAGADQAAGWTRKQGAVKFSSFVATRPLANDYQIAVKILIIAVCSLVVTLAFVAAAVAQTAISEHWNQWTPYIEQVRSLFASSEQSLSAGWVIAGTFTLLLLYVSNTSMILAFGLWMPLHRARFSIICIVVVAHFPLGILDQKFDWGLRYYWIAMGWVVAITILVLTGLAVVIALRSGFLGKRLFVLALCLWAVYFVSSLCLFLKASEGGIPTTLFAMGFASLFIPLASMASAPLALASHRHG